MEYSFDYQLFDEVNVEESKWNTKGRNIICSLAKKNVDAEYWPRLTKDKTKHQNVQIDWNLWNDEDDVQENPNKGVENMDMEGMKGFDMGDYGAQHDSDDEEEPEENKHLHDHHDHDHEGHSHDHDHEGHHHEQGHDHGHEEKKPNADLNDLDAEAEQPTQ